MNKIFTTFVFFNLCYISLSAQTDTIYMNNKKISGVIKEVTSDAVKFSYVDEDLVNTVYKNSIDKLIFKNGRVETFRESSSFKKIRDIADYDNVSITAVEGEIKGLYKIGDVSSKAKGTTVLANQERVKQRAYRKLKIQAAMMGANIVYLTNQRTEGNKGGGYFQAASSAETNLTGIAYSTNVPDYEQFMKNLAGKTEFLSTVRYKLWGSDSDYSTDLSSRTFLIEKIIDENGTISIIGDIQGLKNYRTFKVANFDKESFNIYYVDKSTIYNFYVRL